MMRKLYWYTAVAMATLALTFLSVGIDAPDSSLAAQDMEGLVTVTLFVYSGLPNPVFHLSADEIDELVTKIKLSTATPSLPAPEFPSWPPPGFGGFFVQGQGVAGLPDRLFIYNDFIEISEPDGVHLYEDSQGIDPWLIALTQGRAIAGFPYEILSEYTSRSRLAAQGRHQLSHVIARALEDNELPVALGEVTDVHEVAVQADDESPAKTYQVARITVRDVTRGDVRNIIDVVLAKQLVRNLHYQGFQPEALGSQWVLTLESLSDIAAPLATQIADQMKDVGWEPMVETTNLYSIYFHGYGAVCVDWPADRPKKPTLPVEEAAVLDDIKEILHAQLTTPDYKNDEELRRRLLDEVRSSLGEPLLQKVFSSK